MLVRQRRDTFIRRFGALGYITSQLTKRDRVYDEAGAVFLGEIRRQARDSRDAAGALAGLFIDADAAELQQDFEEFALDLEADGFLVTGEAVEELDRKDTEFTYSTQTPKTIQAWASQQDVDSLTRPTDDVMTDYFRENPTIFGAHLELTSRCNERCVHCYQPKEDVRHADLPLVLDILDQLAEMGTASLTLSGGEPTLHRDFVRILAEARRRDMIINVLSNGLELSEDIARALKDTNVNMVQISLYSMDPAVHDDITRVPGSHRRTVAAIERLVAHDVPVQVSTPIMKQNHRAYRDVATWCHERKIRVLSDFIMMAMANFDASNLEHRLDLDQTAEVIQDIIDKDCEYQLLIDTPQRVRDPEHHGKQPVCGVAVDNACFAADGSMYPCAGFLGYVLGNVREQTIREIWEHSERVRFLRTIRNDSFPECMACAAREYCVMCLVRNFNESRGDMFQIADHFCRVAFLNQDLVQRFREERSTPGGIGASP